MSETPKPPSGTTPPAPTPSTVPIPTITAPNAAKKPPASEGNPAFRAMGLPNWRPKLPSRNWLIFWTIVGSWTSALIYDRQQTKKTKQKWCTLVSHIASEPLPTNRLPRKMTIYLSAPPADSLSASREHFVEYVKPVLVAAAMDWDVLEGRREGEVRAALAERIRRWRNRRGERVEVPFEDTATSVLEPLRERIGVLEYDGERGDVVIGRNAWKEYVRGLHEGWLGPMDPPVEQAEEVLKTVEESDKPVVISPRSEDSAQEDVATTPTGARAEAEEAKTTESKKEDEAAAAPVKPLVTPPYNTTESYSSSSLPPSIPDTLGPSVAIPFPHILGFFNTPIRMYRFLNRRALADDIGRRTAAAVLAHHRQYNPLSASGSDGEGGAEWEQQDVLRQEEKEWHKSVHNAKEYAKERVWLNEPTIDGRIGERMRAFELLEVDEERARAIARGTAGIPGRVGGEGEEKAE